jgi:hypothetical protein
MLKNTPVYQVLMRAKLLSDAVAWFEVFKKNPKLQQMIVRLIQEDQLTMRGVDSNNNIIGYYSWVTEMITNGRKQEGDPYNLDDTGQFYESMIVLILTDSLIIKADTAKMEDQTWYDDNILMLTDENMRIFIDELEQNYIKYVRKILFDS